MLFGGSIISNRCTNKAREAPTQSVSDTMKTRYTPSKSEYSYFSQVVSETVMPVALFIDPNQPDIDVSMLNSFHGKINRQAEV